MAKATNLIGKKFGRLIVKERTDDVVGKSGRHYVTWLCDCDCGTKNVIATADHLRNGHAKSCGCLLREKRVCEKKYNKYDLDGDYGVGWTSNTNKEFYFDLDDFDKIKDYCWCEIKNGYIAYGTKNGTVLLHRVVMGENLDESMDVDHIHGEKSRNDNRKSNLRIATRSQNCINKKRQSNNTSGVTGVCWDKKSKKWKAYIQKEGKQIILGYFKEDNFNDAVKIRKEAEEKYFGDWSYDTSQTM